MENMMLHSFELVRPTRIVASGVRGSVGLFVEIEAMVVTPV
jgi:hypothetical protein